MEQTTIEQENWRDDISEPKATLKIEPDKTEAFVFLNEGDKKTSADYGSSIVFDVKKLGTGEDLKWYVNSRNYDLLGQIKTLGKLTGKTVEVARTGSKKSDTRYTIKEIETD